MAPLWLIFCCWLGAGCGEVQQRNPEAPRVSLDSHAAGRGLVTFRLGSQLGNHSPAAWGVPPSLGPAGHSLSRMLLEVCAPPLTLMCTEGWGGGGGQVVPLAVGSRGPTSHRELDWALEGEAGWATCTQSINFPRGQRANIPGQAWPRSAKPPHPAHWHPTNLAPPPRRENGVAGFRPSSPPV